MLFNAGPMMQFIEYHNPLIASKLQRMKNHESQCPGANPVILMRRHGAVINLCTNSDLFPLPRIDLHYQGSMAF